MTKKIFPLASFLLFIIGMACWIPNFFFYNSDNPPIWIIFTPIIGIIGIALALTTKNNKLKYTLIFLNIIVTFSIGLVFFLGPLFLGL